MTWNRCLQEIYTIWGWGYFTAFTLHDGLRSVPSNMVTGIWLCLLLSGVCFKATLGFGEKGEIRRYYTISRAMGIDDIGPKILKHCTLALYQPVYHLFSMCLSQYYIPHEWRIHKITPIFKSGDRTSVNNYRPISLLCTISKVLERIIYNHIIDFVTKNICPTQFGFLRKHSTLQQLLIFVNELFNSYSHNIPTDVIYLDFKKHSTVFLIMNFWLRCGGLV